MTMTPGLEPSAAQPNQNRDHELCRQVLALIPAYALGAVDPEEARFVQAGLARCPEAAAALAEYSVLTEKMLFSAPPTAAPNHLARRLQEALAAQSDPAPTPEPRTRERRSRWSFGRLWTSPMLGFAAAALALLLLVASNVYWDNRYSDLAAQHVVLQEQLQKEMTLAAFVRAGHMQRLELTAATENTPGSHAIVMFDPNVSQALLYAEDFPPLTPGQVYQLWLIKGETHTSGGLFQVDANGFGLLLIDAPWPLRDYDRLGVTPEPASGSPGPTASPVVTGAF